MTRSSRKKDHIQHALSTEFTEAHSLEDVHFVHQAVTNVSFYETQINTAIGELEFSSPIILNAMTGGSIETEGINKQLAMIAKEAKLAMAVGSQMSALKDPTYRSSFLVVREQNPDGIVFANLGSEASVEQAIQAIDMIQADGLQIHLNVIQELIMPEGDRDFRYTLDRLQAIREHISIPIIIKEVGFGLSKESVQLLKEIGFTVFDVGGKGGTNFARIENARRSNPLLYFNDWGISTANSILEASTVNQIDIIASGGIQNAIQVAKALGLGAKAVGMAGSILKFLILHGQKETIQWIENLHEEIRIIMTGLGIAKIEEFQRCPKVITGEVKNWCDQRGIRFPVK